MWWAFKKCITAFIDEAVVVHPLSFEQMLAKWVLVISGIDGWDFLARLFKTWGVVMLIPMVLAAGSCISGGEEINGDIKWANVRVIWEAFSWFSLNILFHTDQVGEGGKDLEDGEQSVTDLVVK
jgi:hypothetical protein